MNIHDDWFLVVGYGSIGRRHFQNLLKLGFKDVRLLRSGTGRVGAFENPVDVKVYTELEDALMDRPSVVVVANPTSLHVPIAKAALESSACVFLEKPVSADLDSARSLHAVEAETHGVCAIGYCYRYHPLYRQLYDTVKQDRLGRIFHACSWWASYLPYWHPWEDYRSGYAARADLGGGVIGTLDHELDMLRWIVGEPVEVLASAGPISGIGVSVEDTADMIFRLRDKVQANVHLSFGRHDYTRGMWVVGEAGSANLDWNSGMLTISKGKEVDEKIELPQDFDLNSIYIDILRDALEGFYESEPRAVIPLSAGIAALEMAVGALKSSASGRSVKLKGVSL
jgi:predicted dehydrogenase